MPLPIELSVNTHGTRLDLFIAQNKPELSRSFIQKLITAGNVLLNGKQVRAGNKLKTGDKISMQIPPLLVSDIEPECIPLNIVFENSDMVVVDKPAGMTTHPAPGSPSHTLVNAVLSHLPRLPENDSPARPGIVHRLDKNTSGLIIVAKTPSAMANLAAQFKSRMVKKTYLALICGKMKVSEGVIDAPIGRDKFNRKRMTIDSLGRNARTAYTVLAQFEKYSFVEVRPETGRTHQIRVHFASIKHPVVGDEVYGSKSDLIGRHFLHASRLNIVMPSTKDKVEFYAPLPNDLQEVLELLRNN